MTHNPQYIKKWQVIQSPTKSEMYAVNGVYLVADNLPIEDAIFIAAAPLMLQACKLALAALLLHFDNDDDGSIEAQASNALLAAIKQATGEV